MLPSKWIVRFKFVLLLFSISCIQEEKFNSDLWKKKGVDWWMDDRREEMVKDLIQSDTLIGLKKEDVVTLLAAILILDFLLRESA